MKQAALIATLPASFVDTDAEQAYRTSMKQDPESESRFVPKAENSAPRFRMIPVLASLVLAVGVFSGCSKQDGAKDPASEEAAQQAVEAEDKLPEYAPFELKPEPQVPCVQAEHVDVNLGNAPEVFVQAAYCQVKGKPAADEEVAKWAQKLRHDKYTRRIDVVKHLCIEDGRDCQLVYSDPWKSQVELAGAPQRKVKREVGAVWMFFFNCPGQTNCEMHWANTHAPGMAEKSPALAFGDDEANFYDPDNPGFWYRELLDAQWAGLSFLMPNVYGPDIEDGTQLQNLQKALEAIDDPPKIAMFDDSWTWGEPWFTQFWKQRPDMTKTEETAKLIFEAKWKPFFAGIGKKYWYRYKGKPFIYIYTAGKLQPRTAAAPVYARMKELFKEEFGEEPFLMMDSAFYDDHRMKDVADSSFRWFTFQMKGKRSREDMNGHTINHAMVRWDSIGREHKRPAKPGDLLIKDGAVLQQVLDETKDDELLVLATWNDLGEGTGVNRNYDYYAHGHWLAPNHFMKMIRDSQSGK
jgi:hypothetical protein